MNPAAQQLIDDMDRFQLPSIVPDFVVHEGARPEAGRGRTALGAGGAGYGRLPGRMCAANGKRLMIAGGGEADGTTPVLAVLR